MTCLVCPHWAIEPCGYGFVEEGPEALGEEIWALGRAWQIRDEAVSELSASPILRMILKGLSGFSEKVIYESHGLSRLGRLLRVSSSTIGVADEGLDQLTEVRDPDRRACAQQMGDHRSLRLVRSDSRRRASGKARGRCPTRCSSAGSAGRGGELPQTADNRARVPARASWRWFHSRLAPSRPLTGRRFRL